MVEQLFHLYYGLENNTWLYFMQYLLWNFLLKLKPKGFSRASIFQFNWITSWVFINRVYINLGFEITMLFSPRFIMYIYGCLHYFFSLIFYPHLMHKLSLDISQFYRSAQLGQELRHHLLRIQQQYPNYIREVRGRGLFNAVELNSKNLCPISAYDICLQLKERVLAKPTHDTIIRLTPPLSIR